MLIEADDARWQQLADAAFFYLNTSVHPSAPSSTSIYGLAQWNDYHYYYGHVMWDIETFCVAPLLFCQPDAAHTLLEYRKKVMPAARNNAKLHGRRGIQYPWESGPLHGEEASPGVGHASWYEDHVSLDVAWAFAQYSHATGDPRFAKEDASAVLYGVADWIASRVARRDGGFDIRETMGIAERKQAADNDAFTVMSACMVLAEAIALAERHGDSVLPAWREVLAGLEPPRHTRTGVIMSHDGYHPNEEKGSTPGPLAGLFPVWYGLEADVAQRTLKYYLELADDYVGSPMLSPLYGVWAAWAGDRALATRLYEQGYAELVGDRYPADSRTVAHPVPRKASLRAVLREPRRLPARADVRAPGDQAGAGRPEWVATTSRRPAGGLAIHRDRAGLGADATGPDRRPSRRREGHHRGGTDQQARGGLTDVDGGRAGWRKPFAA